MVKVNSKVCSRCKYRCYVEQKLACNYMGCTGKSRIFEKGQQAYDAKYCDKFEKGRQDRTRWVEISFPKTELDEFDRYKFDRIQEEQSKYVNKIKHKRGKVGSN